MEREQLYVSTIDPDAGDVARRYGLGVEIASFCTAWNMDTHLPETEQELEKTLAGITRRVFHGPFNELFPCAIDPKARELARERFRQCFPLAQRYGAGKVVLHGGFNPWIYFTQWYREQSVVFWRDFLCEIPDGITVCLENVMEQNPDLLLSIVQAVDDPKLRLCLDVGHCNTYSKIPVLEWLNASAPYLSHMHIHNNSGDGDTHSPLYAGTIPIKELLERAGQLCTGVTVTLELMKSLSSVQWLLEE